MSNTISKRTVYLFLKNKKQEVIKKEVYPLQEALEIEKNKALKELMGKIDLKRIVESTKSLKKDYEDIRDLCSYSYGNVSNLSSYLGSINNEKDIETSIKNCMTWSGFPDVVKVSNKLEDVQIGIRQEYTKLDNMVKNCSTGNKAVRMLKEIGFDTSEIVNETPKNEVLVLNVNKKFLGI